MDTFYKTPTGTYVNTKYADPSLAGTKVYSAADAGIQSQPVATATQNPAYTSPNINSGSLLAPIYSGNIDPLQANSYLNDAILNNYKSAYGGGSGNNAYLNAFNANGPAQVQQLLSQLNGQSINFGGQTYQFQNGSAYKSSTTVNQTNVGSSGTTTSTGQLNNYQYIDTAGNPQTIQAATPSDALAKAPNINPSSGVRLLSVGAVSPAQAPTNASNVPAPSSGVTLPTNSPSFGNISGATAGTTGMSTLLDTLIKQTQDYQTQIQQQESNNAQVNQGFLSKLISSPSPADARAQAISSTGVNPVDYFAQEKAQIAEIGSLTEQYNGLIAAKDQQVAQANDKLGSNDFINNQIAQIERNAAPQINELSANINSKAAVLQASQGQFAEAQNYVNQAVQDATAESAYNLQLFQTFYQVNQDSLNRLDTKYQQAFSSALTLAQNQYNQQVQDKSTVGQLMISNPKAGISITDSLDTAYQKAGLNPAGDFQIVESNGGIYKIDKNTGQMTTLKSPTGSSLTASQEAQQQIDFYNTAFSPGQTINGGTPTVDANGYITPAAWKAAITSTTMTVDDFIKRYGNRLYAPNGNVDPSYGLTPAEAKLITG